MSKVGRLPEKKIKEMENLQSWAEIMGEKAKGIVYQNDKAICRENLCTQ